MLSITRDDSSQAVDRVRPLQDGRQTTVFAPGARITGRWLKNKGMAGAWQTRWLNDSELQLTIYWQAARPIEAEYSMAVHLVAQDPPASEADILAQADRGHPVDGWYPVTHWREGEIARDQYLLLMPKGNAPAAMRIAMYRSDPELGFINSPWLSLPIPEK